MAWRGNPENNVPNVSQTSTVKSEALDSVNRANQVKRDTDTQKNPTFRLIDIDTTIMKSIEKFQIQITDNGGKIKVPIFYASPEKWKSIQKDGVIRDYNGKLQLPALVFHRTTTDKNQDIMMFNRYLNYPVMKKYSAKNRYTPFGVLVGQNTPINEVYDVVMPDHVVLTYHFIIWTEYVEQNNYIVERLNFETDDYWGDLRGMKFRTKIDTFSHTVELQTDTDRMVKSEFDLVVYAYLLPDLMETMQGKRNTTQKHFTPKKVVMGLETVQTAFPFDDRIENQEKWKSQTYPNLDAGTEPEAPPVVLERPIGPIDGNNGGVKKAIWHFPPPTDSNSSGNEGWISYDADYYYIYTGGFWKRAPQTLVNSLVTTFDEKKWVSYDSDYIYIDGSPGQIPISLFNNY
jgi:hypothetical protein